MQAIRFIIMAVALPKGHFPGGKPRPRRGRESVTIRYSRLLIPTTVLAAGERHAQPASYYPKRKPGWRKKCRSGGVYYNFFTLQDRLDLTHEYLHLAFDGYPTGLDENYIETLTRQLLMD